MNNKEIARRLYEMLESYGRELRDDVAALADELVPTMKQPDWEGFARAIMEYWPDGDVDGGELQDTAEYYGLLRKERYDPKTHGELGREEFGIEPGDDWYVLNYALRPKEARDE